MDRWLSVDQLSNYLGVSKESIYRWLESKKLPGHKIGRQWRFKESEIDSWITNGSAANMNRRKGVQLEGNLHGE